MYIKGYVNECDFTGVKYDKPVLGVHALCRGATGRWCCVMYAGPDYAAASNFETITYAAACAEVAKNPGDYVDFEGFEGDDLTLAA